MCAVLLPPGDNAIAVNKYVISYSDCVERKEPFPYLLPFFTLLIGFPLLFPDEKLYGTTATGKLSAENQSDRRRNFTSANLSTTNLATINL
jgi:hypothetical protein